MRPNARRLLGVLLVSTLSSLALVGRARAHVEYVSGDEPAGSVAELFTAIATDPLSLALLGLGTVGVVALALGYLRFSRLLPDVAVARRTLQAYRPYVPWMLRLSMGLPLVGAGFAGYLFTPALPVEARILQVSIGFLLLFGLATRLVAVVGLLSYLGLLATDQTLLLASEYIAGFLGIIIVGPGQPSADMLLRRLVVTDGTIASRARGLPRPAALLERLGVDNSWLGPVVRLFVGFNFLYLGVTQKWLNPESALAVVAKYDLTAVVPVSPELWVVGAGLIEAGIGVAFLLGLFTRAGAAAGFLMLTTTLFGLPDDPVLAHVTLFGLLSVLLVTGSGPYSLDNSILPAIRERLSADLREPVRETPAD